MTRSDNVVLVITGSMGAGKTTLMAEASDLLIEREIPHAAIDLDTLGIGFITTRHATGADRRSDGMPPHLENVMYRNLSAVWQNFRDAGAQRLLISAAIEKRDMPFMLKALRHPQTVICRLRAPLDVMRRRVQLREPGMFQQKFMSRVAELDALLNAAGLETFSLANDGQQPITDLAKEMLTRAGWI